MTRRRSRSSSERKLGLWSNQHAVGRPTNVLHPATKPGKAQPRRKKKVAKKCAEQKKPTAIERVPLCKILTTRSEDVRQSNFHMPLIISRCTRQCLRAQGTALHHDSSSGPPTAVAFLLEAPGYVCTCLTASSPAGASVDTSPMRIDTIWRGTLPTSSGAYFFFQEGQGHNYIVGSVGRPAPRLRLRRSWMVWEVVDIEHDDAGGAWDRRSASNLRWTCCLFVAACANPGPRV